MIVFSNIPGLEPQTDKLNNQQAVAERRGKVVVRIDGAALTDEQQRAITLAESDARIVAKKAAKRRAELLERIGLSEAEFAELLS
jgi:hypothetical protein